jgi:amino acid adenylation domain-containing protein
MVPAAYVRLQSFPLTANGKLDRKALPAPGTAAFAVGRYEAPVGEIETVLAKIWEDILDLEQVGRHDNYFALGGDSIRVIRLLSKAQEYGWHLTPQQVFRHQTIASLASQILAGFDESQTCSEEIPVILLSSTDQSLLPAEVEDAYSLSALQMGMLFHNQLGPELGTYHDVFSYHLRMAQDWDLPSFTVVLNALTVKHPILRTSISLDRFSEPLQLVHQRAAIPVTVSDISEYPKAAQDEMISAWVKQESKRSFDLDMPPLLHIFIHLRSPNVLQYTLSFHHAILDGWSVAAFQTELFEEYAKVRRQAEKKLSLKPLAANFKMAVAAEKRCQESEQAKSFWKTYLEGYSISSLPPLDLDEEQSHTGSFEQAVPARLQSGLAQIAASWRVSMKSVFLTAHCKVIGILSGSRDVVTGVVTHNRPHVPDGERVLGLFLNTLPLRLNLSPSRWRELVQAAFASELKIVPYHAYPYFKFFQENGRVPVFESVFNYVDFHVYDQLRETGEVEMLGSAVFEKTNFALTTNVVQQREKIQLLFHFDSHRLSTAQIRRIADYYLSTLNSIMSECESFHDQCDCLPEAERHQMLYAWNATRTSFSSYHLHEIIESKAAQIPEAIALSYEAHELSYRQLNERANQVAHYLIELGVRPEARVGICLERGIETVIALLGILKSGGAYIPLDPDHPQERLEYVLADASVQVLLTQGNLLPRTAKSEAVKICVDLDWEKISRYGPHNPGRTIHHENVAYVIYTSGSTGRPKGVMVSQGALMNFMRSMQEIDLLQTPCRLLAVTTISFDIAALELYLPLVTGGTVVIANRQIINDGARLGEVLRQWKIDAMQATPATWRLLVDANWNGPMTVLCGGEALSWNLADRLSEGAGESGAAVNLYGPTEATIWCTYRYFGGNDSHSTAVVPLGRPIHNTRMYVLQMGMQPAPMGAIGELHIAGANLARGYLDRPDLTADRFRPDPFSDVGGERVYATGDLGRWLSNGSLEFQGRIDHQVKIRGFRIELGEIEAALLEQDGVEQAVVVAREDEPGLERLVAYIVREKGSTLDVDELGGHLQRRLPEYMVPPIFVPLEELPVTANGKIDRQRLPLPKGRNDDKQYSPPRTEIEQILCGAFADVLRVERVGRDDEFFGLGGHSLVATQLIARVRQAFDIDLPLGVLFETPRVSDLGAWVKQERLGGGAAKVLRVGPRGEDLPLSYAQERLWFLHYLDKESSSYHIPFALRLQGVLNKTSLRRSFYAIVERHEALRTSFPARRGQPVQVILPEPNFQFDEIDLSTLESGDAEVEVRRLAKVEAHSPFQLDKGPLLRIKLLQLREDEHILLVTLHHIIWDVWSQQVMVRELAALYNAFCGNALYPLKPLPIQYADYAIWQKGWIKERLSAQRGYWKAKLANYRPTRFPIRSEANGNDAHQPVTEGLSLSEDESAALSAICRRANVTHFMFFLAELKILLSYYTKTVDIAVGTNVANRSVVETEDLIGLFVNQLVLRTDLSGNPALGEVLRRVRGTVVNGYDHQDVPFEKIVAAVMSQRSTPHSSLFHIRLDYVENVTEMRVSDLEVSSLQLNADPLHDDMRIVITNLGLYFNIQIIYDARLFDRHGILDILDGHKVILESARDMTVRLDDIWQALELQRKSKWEAQVTELRDRGHQRLKAVKRKAVTIHTQ